MGLTYSCTCMRVLCACSVSVPACPVATACPASAVCGWPLAATSALDASSLAPKMGCVASRGVRGAVEEGRRQGCDRCQWRACSHLNRAVRTPSMRCCTARVVSSVAAEATAPASADGAPDGPGRMPPLEPPPLGAPPGSTVAGRSRQTMSSQCGVWGKRSTACACVGTKGSPWKDVDFGRQSATALATKAGAWHDTKMSRVSGRHARSALSTSGLSLPDRRGGVWRRGEAFGGRASERGWEGGPARQSKVSDARHSPSTWWVDDSHQLGALLWSKRLEDAPRGILCFGGDEGRVQYAVARGVGARVVDGRRADLDADDALDAAGKREADRASPTADVEQDGGGADTADGPELLTQRLGARGVDLRGVSNVAGGRGGRVPSVRVSERGGLGGEGRSGRVDGGL